MTSKKILIFGEVLWDIFPDGTRNLGGAPFNVAWHLQAFGANPLFISRIGNDNLGVEIQEKMLAWGLTSKGLQIDSLHPTGTVQVRFEHGHPQYEITAACAYDFIDVQQFPNLPENFLLYHGSLAVRHSISQSSFTILQNQAKKTFFDVNLRTPWWTQSTIDQSLIKTDFLKLNTEELQLMTNPSAPIESNIKDVFQRNTSLQYILLTQGEAGAMLYDKQGDRHQIEPQHTSNVIDTVGAGDAFCSIFLLGLVSNWSLTTTLERAQTFASAIVGIRGAVSQDPTFYRPFIQAWHSI
ncbi:carbohydrate kinase [Synechococcus moorigangaii CMS01]|nr:carbohydrate kinase [Synechococcus moorigangaii CMS01]